MPRSRRRVDAASSTIRTWVGQRRPAPSASTSSRIDVIAEGETDMGIPRFRSDAGSPGSGATPSQKRTGPGVGTDRLSSGDDGTMSDTAGTIEDALDELLAVPVAEFVAARDALARQLRADGDRGGADVVK